MVLGIMTPTEVLIASFPHVRFSVCPAHSSTNSFTAPSKSNFERAQLQDLCGNRPMHIKAIQLTQSEVTKLIWMQGGK